MSRSASPSPYVASTSPRAPLPALRMTRRGRLLLLLVLAALLLVAFSIGRVSSSAAVTGLPGPTARTVVVAPGQSLWEIARRAVPGADPRAVVTELEQLNHLSTASLHPGQRLVVPSP